MILIDTSDFRRNRRFGQQSVGSSGMVCGMTSPPLPTLTATGNPIESGGVVDLWFLATCHRCGGDLSVPFRDEDERDDWAAAHVLGTGHIVFVSTDGAAYSRVIRPDSNGAGFKFLCTNLGPGCSRWNGPYDSPQIALASARAHVCEVPE